MDFFQNIPKFQKTTIFTPTSIILYTVLAIFIVCVILMLLKVQIPWEKLNPIPRKYSTYMKAYKYWPPSGIFQNLKVLEKDAVKLSDSYYSLSIECVLYNTRNYMSTEGPYRHILHRGSDELAATTVGGIITGCGSGNSYGDLPPFGLPKRLNPGIFLDPNVNDILVFVDTVGNGASVYRESIRIPDIPLDIPFRLQIVVNERLVEIYINCKLETTRLLKAIPRYVENSWYGISGSASADAQIQNLNIWSFPLTASDIRPLCPSIPTFTTKRPICPSTNSVAPKPVAKLKMDSNFGINLQLSNNCPA